MNIRLSPVNKLKALCDSVIDLPSDKSISHRALLLGAMTQGTTQVFNLKAGDDVRSTRQCLASLGAKIEDRKDHTLISGKGTDWQLPAHPLDCGNSGTTLRLLLGALSGTSQTFDFLGDESLHQRPMARVTTPLSQMGASFQLAQSNYLPIRLTGTKGLRAIDYALPVASAQLKSALLLAALQAEGKTRLSGKLQSRDHTERMLKYMGATLETTTDSLCLQGGQTLHGAEIQVPSDPSSAAYWVVLALLIPEARLEINNVLLNPFRTGYLDVLKRMGAKIQTEVQTLTPEPIGRILVSSSPLCGTSIHPNEIPSVIDELPLLALAAGFSEGLTTIEGAEELRIKESDRINSTIANLQAMKVEAQATPNGMKIFGRGLSSRFCPSGAKLRSFGDHRIAMTFAIGALAARGDSEVSETECVSISYPGFFETLRRIVL